jgi:hypothetical protein
VEVWRNKPLSLVLYNVETYKMVPAIKWSQSFYGNEYCVTLKCTESFILRHKESELQVLDRRDKEMKGREMKRSLLVICAVQFSFILGMI